MKILDVKAAGTVEGGPTYSLKNRAFRGFWSLTWFFLAAWTPAPANRWRLFLLSLFGAKIAPEAFVYGSARVWYPPHFEAGRYARISPSVTVYCVAKITVADYAIVSQGSTLCTAGHDIQDPHFQTVAQPITIGPQARVAAEAFVGPGVSRSAKALSLVPEDARFEISNPGRSTPAIPHESSNFARSA